MNEDLKVKNDILWQAKNQKRVIKIGVSFKFLEWFHASDCVLRTSNTILQSSHLLIKLSLA